jgi:hypothetical protein
MYFRLQNLPKLATNKPDKIGDFLPDNVTYDTSKNELTHTYRGGEKVITNLSALKLESISLISKDFRRAAESETR